MEGLSEKEEEKTKKRCTDTESPRMFYRELIPVFQAGNVQELSAIVVIHKVLRFF